MSLNLLETVKDIFNQQVITNTASALNENESSVSKAVSATVPAILSGIIAKATSGDHGPGTILDLAATSHNGGFLNNISGFLGSNNSLLSRGIDMLKNIFGNHSDSIASAISNYAGIKQSSATSLMGTVAPVALAAIGDHVHQNGLNSMSLTNWLQSQKNTIVNALPGGLSSSLSGLLGLGTLGAAASNVTSTASSTASSAVHTAENYVEKKSGNRFLIPILLAIGALILIIYLLKGCGRPSTSEAVATDTTKTVKTDTTTTAPMMAKPESIKVKLPNGVELDAYKGGIEDQLVAFLMTDYKKLGADSLKNKWFDFDNLTFKTASAEITPESQHQIDNITAILKAFPKTKVKIGGYTDKTGNEEGNKKLSNARAASVRSALDKTGVGSQVTGAEGYGSQYAKYAADAPDSDRVKDRRISLSVRE